MNTKKYNWILYLITATIITTVAVQFYWNYKNYQENKKRVTNEIQISLDNTVEEYYSSLSKNNFFGFINSERVANQSSILRELVINDHFHADDSIRRKVIRSKWRDSLTDFVKKYPFSDSIFVRNPALEYTLSTDTIKNYALDLNGYNINLKIGQPDTLKLFKGIQSVVIALSNDDLDFKKFDSIFNQQLASKGITTEYYFNYIDNDSLRETTRKESDKKLHSFANAKSTYLSPRQELKLYHVNPTLSALKRSSTGILLSFLLSLTVIGSLFYLLRIINKQKELAEIKNDLISNITHEFKTPIATVSTAIEAIENFNVIDDKEKTQKYLSMSSLQLKKLHQMVEKLLETATLDSEKLILNKEQIDVIDLVSRITTKHELLTDKKISFSSNVDSKVLNIDLFHFENAVSNLIDNAIKYGGDNVEVTINAVLNTTEISVADDGNGIEKGQHEKIFDKFYRVPKGNKHDVKGFGIGLYYAKKIVEKHDGSIHLASNNSDTVFKISLPNG